MGYDMTVSYMIGSMMNAYRSRVMALGFTLHLVLGMAFALLYALVFEGWQ